MADWTKIRKQLRKAEGLIDRLKDEQDPDIEEILYTAVADKSSCGVFDFCKRVAGKLVCK